MVLTDNEESNGNPLCTEEIQEKGANGNSSSGIMAEEAKELFLQGKRNLLCGNIDEAVECLGACCVNFTELYGEFDVRCAEPLLTYGRALLEASRREPCLKEEAVINGDHNNVAVADSVDPQENVPQGPETVQNDSDKEENALERTTVDKPNEDTKVDGPVTVEPEKVEGDDIPTADVLEDNKTVKVCDLDNAADEVIVSHNESDDDTCESNDESELDENSSDAAAEVPDLQLAWEMVDLARIIWEKEMNDDGKLMAAECRLVLAEISMESDNHEEALKELNGCLSVQKTLLPSCDRRIAHCYYQIGLANMLGKKYSDAHEAFSQTLNTLKMKRDELQQKDSTNGSDANAVEIADLDSVIKDVAQCMQDALESSENPAPSSLKLEDENEIKITSKDNTDSPMIHDISHLVRKSLKEDKVQCLLVSLARKAKMIFRLVAVKGNYEFDGVIPELLHPSFKQPQYLAEFEKQRWNPDEDWTELRREVSHLVKIAYPFLDKSADTCSH
ncbi:unnamed protein product [Soboliphyme baturini]|uniref:SHNi-TPR domain-containing protein n=1 Tax=Soboliphyme baturini TaxID=241478 RepID=A0A183IPC5_9BILA|nr:unnamed protein product [Soboliphyme baturini]